ncbi:MAG: hypothetical protein ACTHK4_16125 [Mycobacteriales bacterium]
MQTSPQARRGWRLRRAARLRQRVAHAVAEGRSLEEIARSFGLPTQAAARLAADVTVLSARRDRQ